MLPNGAVAFAPGPRPNITGAGKKWKVGVAGGGKYAGWWVAKPIKPRPPTGKGGAGAGGSKPPAPPAGPYDEYATTAPWGKRLLEDLDRREQAHLGYVTGQVLPWLRAGLEGLTGVNPAAPGYNSIVQQQYQANLRGNVANAFDAAAAATPMQVAPTTPGGAMGAPNAYMGAAMQEASRQRGGAAIQEGDARAVLNAAQPNIFAQAAYRSVADISAGLPMTYVEKRNSLRAKIDEFVMQAQSDAAELAERERHNRVTEAISGMNAQTNAAIQFGRLGLSADELGMDQVQAAQEANAPVPYGFVRLPDGRIARDPQVPSARAPSSGGGSSSSGGGTSTRDAQGRPRVPWLQQEGWSGNYKVKPKKLPKGWRAVQGANGRWWVKGPGSPGGGGAKPKTGKTAQEVYEKLVTANDKGLISSEQSQGTPDLLRFLRPLQPPRGPAWNRWFAEILKVLDRVDPAYGEWIEGWVKRRRADGTWKGTL